LKPRNRIPQRHPLWAMMCYLHLVKNPKDGKRLGYKSPGGCYPTRAGVIINADCNATLNILQKVEAQLGFLNPVEACRAVLTLPASSTSGTRSRNAARRWCLTYLHQPGGQCIGRPPRMCRCRWYTVCPPSGPVLMTTR
jgi:hypothetical protein